jgi:hypothetical protein
MNQIGLRLEAGAESEEISEDAHDDDEERNQASKIKRLF